TVFEKRPKFPFLLLPDGGDGSVGISTPTAPGLRPACSVISAASPDRRPPQAGRRPAVQPEIYRAQRGNGDAKPPARVARAVPAGIRSRQYKAGGGSPPRGPGHTRRENPGARQSRRI